MSMGRSPRVLLLLLPVVLALSQARAPAPPAAKGPVDFARDVEPILRSRCQSCHGPQQQMSGLRLDQAEAALRGGSSGPVIVPGNSAASKLIQRVTSAKPEFAMPFGGPPLAAAEVDILRAWIAQGARWPKAESATPAAGAAKPAAPASGHWAFQPIRRPQAPEVRNRAWLRNPVDAFVLEKLEAEGISPAPEADRSTLLRRLYLDLTGLPPTPQEVAQFLADNRPNAYEKLADSLLASAHYGERWARSWLDLAHYADSDGYEKDLVRPFAWRYRDWVIEAFNRDMPFDQFTIEQLAADLLPGATAEQRVATGFLRNTLTNREAGVTREEIRFEQLVDRTNTVATTWLGLTMGCAQCHNHKYDPITQKDYYRFQAFFENAEEADIEAPLPGEVGPYLRSRREYLAKRSELLAEYQVPELEAAWEREMLSALDAPGRKLDWDFAVSMMRALLDGGEKILRLEPEKRSERQRGRLTDYFISSSSPLVRKDEKLLARFKELREKLRALETSYPSLSRAPTMVDDPQPRKGYVRLRGDYRRKGIEVEPGPPSSCPRCRPARLRPGSLWPAGWSAGKTR